MTILEGRELRSIHLALDFDEDLIAKRAGDATAT
jgi:hypothetical protein